MSSGVCPFCGCTELVVSDRRGDVVCGNPQCGELVEENRVLAEVSFVTGGGGAVAMAGTRVDWSKIGNAGSMQQTNQEAAISRGCDKIRLIAAQLNLPHTVMDAGRRMYSRAVQMSFNVGRPTRFVAAACLYIVCRQTKTPFILLDFADVLRQPVKRIGSVYIGLVRRLSGGESVQYMLPKAKSLEIPVIDPSILIERFARRMDLKSKRHKVQHTAVRLIQFMQRDWICTGRRPNGLCGAALLIASFFHGMRCPAKAIADMVRISENTLSVRLIEMRDTPIATMQRHELDTMDPADRRKAPKALPPCLIKRRRLRALGDAADRALLQDADSNLGGYAPVPLPASVAAEAPHRIPPSVAPTEAPTTPARTEAPTTPAPPPDGEPGERKDGKDAAKFTASTPGGEDLEDIAADIADSLMQGGRGSLRQSVEDLLASKPDSDGKFDPSALRSDVLSPTSAVGSAEHHTPQAVASADGDESEALSDMDAEELNEYLLTPEEQQCKSDIWHEVNKDYLEDWYHRRLEKIRKRERAEESKERQSQHNSETASQTSTTRKRRDAGKQAGSSPAESTMMAVRKKSKAQVLNPEALDALFA